MLFKDIKQNYPVYILDKAEMTFQQGKVVSVSLPRMNMQNNTPTAFGQLPQTVMLVDVTIETSGRTATYSIPENLSVTYAGNLVLSTDKDGISREVEAAKNSAEQALKQVEQQRKIVERSTALLSELNPVYREKKETEERFSKIETSVSEMKNMLAGFIKEFKN